MNRTFRNLFSLLTFVVLGNLSAQNDTIYHRAYHSYSAILSQDGKTAAYVTEGLNSNQTLHILDTKSFNQIDSILLPKQPQKMYPIWKLDFMGNSGRYLILKDWPVPNQLEKSNISYIYDIQEKKFKSDKFSSDVVFEYSDRFKDYIVGKNTYKSSLPKIRKNVLKSSIKSTLRFGNNDIKHDGQLLDIELSPDQNILILAYYISESELGRNYELQARSFPDLTVLATKNLTEQPFEISFVKNSKQVLVVEHDYSGYPDNISTIEKLNLLDLPSLKKSQSINKEFYIDGRIHNQNFWVFNIDKVEPKGVLRNIEYNSGKTLLEIPDDINNNRINDFLLVNDIIIAFSEEKVFQISIPDRFYQFKNVNQSRFDTIERPARISFNNFPTNRHKLDYNNSEFLFVLEKQKLSLWNVKKKRKVTEQRLYYGNEDSEVFLEGKSAKAIVHTESENGKFCSLEFIDFGKNTLQSHKYHGNDFGYSGILYPTAGSWRFFHFPLLDKWVCWDGSLELWEFTSNVPNRIKEMFTKDEQKEFFPGNFFFDKLYSFQQVPEKIIPLKTSNSILVDFKDKNLSYLKIDSLILKSYSNTSHLNLENLFSQNKVLMTKGNKIQLYNLKDSISEALNFQYKKNVPKTKYFGNRTVFMERETIDYKDYGMLSIFNNKTHELIQSITLDNPSSDNFVLDYPEVIYNSNQNLAVIDLEAKSSFQWSTLENDNDFEYAKISKTTRDGVFFFHDYLINFQNLTLRKVSNDSSIVTNVYVKNDTTYIGSIVKKAGDFSNKYFKIEKLFHNSGKKFESGILPDYDRRMVCKVAENSNYLLAHPEDFFHGYFYLLDLDTKKWYQENLEENETLSNAGFKNSLSFKDISFTDDSKHLLIYCSKFSYDYFEMIQKTFLYDIGSKKIIRTFDNRVYQIKKDGKTYYREGNLTVNEGHLENRTLNKKQYFLSKNKSFFTYDDEDSIFLSFDNGNLLVYKDSIASPIKYIDLMSIEEVMNFTSDGKNLYVAMTDGSIKIVDVNTLELKLTLFIFKRDNSFAFLFLTPEGYFSAPKEVIRNFHFVRGLKTYPLLNYEIFLNRPDIILERLDFADQSKIEIYKEAYLKRLKRNNLSPEIDILSLPTPEIALINSNEIPNTTIDKELTLKIKTSRDTQKIFTYINSVPVAFIMVKGDKDFFEQKILLSEGNNKISIIARNQNGVESDPVNLQVTKTTPPLRSNTFFIGIGVSKYQDSTMNLTYADKDVHALARSLKKIYGESLIIDTLTNESATIVNISAIKKKLENTNINDRVILSFSGHGLVDEDLEFYFSPYGMDFSNPAVNGFSYMQMQELLTDIPARRKLMLIDACHSGELESEEELKNIFVENGKVSSKMSKGAKGAIPIGDKKSDNLQNSFDLMKSLFYDLDRGNGSYVISAAGGLEYAFEDATWSNGVFTYAIIQGLEELSGKKNGNDGVITISELKNYVENKVEVLTEGKQKPTSRVENIEWDWELN
ncbi:MAG: caspase family protein [Bacteroidota bacterium]